MRLPFVIAKLFRRKTRFERDYKVGGELSEGGTATIYRAWDKRNQRPVAVKVIKAAAMAKVSDNASLVFEGEIGKRLQHRNIVATLDYGKNKEGNRVVVLELIEGLSLQKLISATTNDESDKIRTFRLVAKQQRCQILGKIAEAILYMHAMGYIHLDLYPRNIMVQVKKRGETFECVPKIIDFGFAAPKAAAGKTRHRGPPPYMAPEALPRSKAKIDEQADVFSFGVIAYQMMTGRLPWDVPKTYTGVAPREPMDLPEDLRAVLFGAVQHDPALRPPLARMIAVLKKHEIEK